MNNSNFGYDCRNNPDNCKFIPIFDELKELITFKDIIIFLIQKFHNLYLLI